MEEIMTRKTTSISEFKANPNREVALAGDEPFCVLTNNRPSFYVMSAKAWDHLMEKLNDAEAVDLAEKRLEELASGVKSPIGARFVDGQLRFEAEQ